MTDTAQLQIHPGPYTPDPESLRQFECPEWFRDAKLAIWSHWGPQSVPMYGDWYARHMYLEQAGSQFLYHRRVYGHPSRVGWKDMVAKWKAEKFDPQGLMQLYVEAGAKYFVGQAMHHDNFDLFDSAHQPRWNSVSTGPGRDIVKLWQEAARAHGLPFGVSEHLGASYSWWRGNKGADTTGLHAGVPYDGTNPAFYDLYHDHTGYESEETWYTSNPVFHAHWFARIKDLIDKYELDLLYTDGAPPFGEYGRSIIAHLYNTSAARHGANRAVYTQKDTNPDIYRFGVLDIERGQRDEIAEHPWQTDTSVGDWFYNVRDVYKTPAQVLETLVDIVSKNGSLLLNIPQRPDGALDDECTFLLKQMASWIKANGEGIYGTRPWRASGEGQPPQPRGHFEEKKVAWTSEDFRFTCKDDAVYVFRMKGAAEGPALVRSLAQGSDRRVLGVHQLGHGPVAFRQTAEGLSIDAVNTEQVGPLGFAVTRE